MDPGRRGRGARWDLPLLNCCVSAQPSAGTVLNINLYTSFYQPELILYTKVLYIGEQYGEDTIVARVVHNC